MKNMCIFVCFMGFFTSTNAMMHRAANKRPAARNVQTSPRIHNVKNTQRTKLSSLSIFLEAKQRYFHTSNLQRDVFSFLTWMDSLDRKFKEKNERNVFDDTKGIKNKVNMLNNNLFLLHQHSIIENYLQKLLDQLNEAEHMVGIELGFEYHSSITKMCLYKQDCLLNIEECKERLNNQNTQETDGHLAVSENEVRLIRIKTQQNDSFLRVFITGGLQNHHSSDLDPIIKKFLNLLNYFMKNNFKLNSTNIAAICELYGYNFRLDETAKVHPKAQVTLKTNESGCTIL